MSGLPKFFSKIAEAAKQAIPEAVEPADDARARIRGFVHKSLSLRKKVRITKEMIDLGMEAEVRVLILQHDFRGSLFRQLDEAEKEADWLERYEF